MNVIRRITLFVGMIMLIATPVVTVAAPTVAFAAGTPACERPILGINPWFHGLTAKDPKSGVCYVTGPGSDLAKYIWRIALNILEIILGVVGYIAFFFILYGGFQFLTGGSNPGQIEKARKTLLNAVIGLVIALSATAVINIIFGILG